MNDKLMLTPIEQRYMASCLPNPTYTYYKEAVKLKEKLRQNSIENKVIEISIKEISIAFPKIAYLYRKGFFDSRSIQSYFEGIDSQAHNLRLYSFAREVANRNFLKEPLMDVLSHVEICSVKVADFKKLKLWSYNEICDCLIDMDYLKISPITGYVFVHGKTDKGHIAIRSVNENEVEIMKKWFEKMQKNFKNLSLKLR